MYVVLFILLLLTGCYQTGPNDDELRTVPVTNNPNLLPGLPRPNPLQAMGY